MKGENYMSKFKAGDIVRVTNWGAQYSTCTSWFTKHASELKLEWMINYRYGNYSWNDNHSVNEQFKVLFVDEDGRCLIGYILFSDDFAHGVYLIDSNGLALARKSMTQDDIEMELGYRVELIGEWCNE